MYDQRRTLQWLGLLVAVGAAVAALVLAISADRGASRQRAQFEALRADMNRRVDVLAAEIAPLARRVRTTSEELKRKQSGLAPLAAHILKSVFTIETDAGFFGAGFFAWSDSEGIYLITANHIVSASSGNFIRVVRKGGSWSGEIVARDLKNDLALVRVSGHPAGTGAPLWPKPVVVSPRTGDELLLVGSPYGLEGTVTTGIVSRVTKRLIQTDAAANPGNSGGPALDRRGRVVGVLVAGGGENLNFAVPIGRACVKLRACS